MNETGVDEVQVDRGRVRVGFFGDTGRLWVQHLSVVISRAYVDERARGGVVLELLKYWSCT